jgi:multidrug efflux pump subunit AcrA (membrane-fusion protein)
MGKYKSLIALSLILVFFGFLSAQQGGGLPGKGRPSGGSSDTGRSGSLILETEISKRANSISVAGRLEPRSRIVHNASVSGTVGELFVDIGDKVQTGDHLFRIDRNDIGQSFKPVYVDSKISGIVSEIDIQLYSDINAGSSGATIVATDSYIARAVISDKDAFKVKVGQRVVGTNPEGLTIRGTLIGRSQEPDYNTGLFSLKFEFSKKEGFYIGSFILIKLSTDQIEGIFISRDLLVRRYGKYFLWLLDSENKLTAREVKSGIVFGNDIQIISGLNPGESYLSGITGKETEGMEVKKGNN